MGKKGPSFLRMTELFTVVARERSDRGLSQKRSGWGNLQFIFLQIKCLVATLREIASQKKLAMMFFLPRRCDLDRHYYDKQPGIYNKRHGRSTVTASPR